MYNHYLRHRRLPQAFITPDVLTQPEQRLKNPNGKRAQVWWRALMMGPFQVSLQPASQHARRIRLNTADIWVTDACVACPHLLSVLEELACHRVLGRTGVSRFYQSGPSSFRLTSYPLTDCTCWFFSLSSFLPAVWFVAAWHDMSACATRVCTSVSQMLYG